MFHVPEQYRDLSKSTPAHGNSGVFEWRKGNKMIRCIASDGEGWEHVSVSIHEYHNRKVTHRMATWDEMCEVKNMFWDEEDVVIQYHPRKSEYVQTVSYVLHMWRPIGVEIPTPPPIFVGIVGVKLA